MATRDGSGGLISGSILTDPVKYSAGPLPEGCEPLRLISMLFLLIGSTIFTYLSLNKLYSRIAAALNTITGCIIQPLKYIKKIMAVTVKLKNIAKLLTGITPGQMQFGHLKIIK
jgi:hypothetical protein